MTKKRKGKKAIAIAPRLAMVLLRTERGWFERGQLAKALRVSPSLVSMWERGERPIPQEALRRTADQTSFPRQLLGPVQRALRSFQRAAQGRSRADRTLDVVVAIDLLPLLLAATDLVLAPLRRGAGGRRARAAADDREAAEALWARLARRTPMERRLIVEEGEEYQTAALRDRVAAESAVLAETNPREAQELAALAGRIGELV